MMNYICVLLLLSSLVSASSHAMKPENSMKKDRDNKAVDINNFDSSPFIVGGNDAEESEFTEFSLVVITPKGSQLSGVCGGTLIAANKILTAAHCITTFGLDSTIKVIPRYHLLSETTQPEARISVINYVIHPDFDELSLENDIAVLTLESEVSGSYSSVIRGADPLIDTMATVIGAGLVDPDVLKIAPVLQTFDTRIESNAECQDELGLVVTFEDGSVLGKLFPSTLCLKLYATPSSPCFGDSGSPLMATVRGREVVVGVSSAFDNSECNGLNTISIYTRASSFTAFIKQASPNTIFINSDFVKRPVYAAINLLLLYN